MARSLEYSAVPYSRDQHEAFVRGSWTRGARRPWEELARHLRRPETRCLVAHVPDDPEALLGWAAVTERSDANTISLGPTGLAIGPAYAVVWVYCRDLHGVIRRRGLGTNLLLDLGVDVSEPTPCLYWSPAATEIAARGYRIYYAPRKRRGNASNRHVST